MPLAWQWPSGACSAYRLVVVPAPLLVETARDLELGLNRLLKSRAAATSVQQPVRGSRSPAGCVLTLYEPNRTLQPPPLSTTGPSSQAVGADNVSPRGNTCVMPGGSPPRFLAHRRYQASFGVGVAGRTEAEVAVEQHRERAAGEWSGIQLPAAAAVGGVAPLERERDAARSDPAADGCRAGALVVAALDLVALGGQFAFGQEHRDAVHPPVVGTAAEPARRPGRACRSRFRATCVRVARRPPVRRRCRRVGHAHTGRGPRNQA